MLHANFMKLKIAILIFLLLFQVIPFTEGKEKFPFHEELLIPCNKEMINQPVDIVFHFPHPCWAVDEKRHSVRVFYSDGKDEREIECQIYNLSFIDGEHIKSCNIVFLLRGKGKYFVYYDDEETPPPDYPDHVSVSDASYYYEPIPGYSIDLNYYSIREDGYCLYGIGQEGTFLGIDMSQKVVKQLNGKKDFDIKNWGQLASFAMFWYEDRDKGTDEKLLSKEVLVDGNLMVRVGLVSTSKGGEVKTTSFYTYYYSPSEEKRLIASVHHEVLKPISINGITEEDGMYVYLLTVRGRSASIPNLNLGYIPPYLHINTENGLQEYHLNQNPESTKYQWVLSTKDDIDLGNPPWFSIDDGKEGRAYAIIFDRNRNVSQIEDGIQVKAVERQEVSVPGLEIDGGGVSGGRNSYESGGKQSLSIQQGFSANFVAEFFSSPHGGIQSADKEAKIFSALLPYREIWNGEISNERKEEGYNVTVYAHLAPSIPFSSMLSVATGKKFSVISAEIWNEDRMLSSGVCSRISLRSQPESIRDVLTSIDWRNFSFIKKITFPSIPKGDYMIKIYRKGRANTCIGGKYVSIDGDTSIHIFCKMGGKLEVLLQNQHQKGVEGAKIFLLKENKIFSVNNTDAEGKSILLAPSPSFYVLKVIYKGFVISNESIFLPPFAPIKKSMRVELNDVNVKIKDALGFSPGVHLSPVLKREGISFTGREIGDGEFVFPDMPPGDYMLFVKYKSFYYETKCSVPENCHYEIQFPAVYSLTIKTFTSRGIPLKSSISVKRENFDEKKVAHTSTFSLPPAYYEVSIYSNGKIIGKRSVFLTENSSINMITTKKSNLFYVLEGLCIASIFFLAFLLISKKIHFRLFISSLAFLLLILSIISPWWYLHGKGDGDVTTKVYLIPPKMVTIGKMQDAINGEMAILPSQFKTMLYIVLSFLVISTLFLFFIKRKLILLSIFLVVGAILLFSYGMNAFSNVTTGSFFGEGYISISLPGSSEETFKCIWLPGSGYFLSILSLMILIAPLFKKFIHEMNK